jgi:hypothetical protein
MCTQKKQRQPRGLPKSFSLLPSGPCRERHDIRKGINVTGGHVAAALLQPKAMAAIISLLTHGSGAHLLSKRRLCDPLFPVDPADSFANHKTRMASS